MAFPHATITIAFVLSGGRCDCLPRACGHPVRCTATFPLGRATASHAEAGWVPHHRQAALAHLHGIANCEVLRLDCSGRVLR